MLIALDYDQTFTLDPPFWRNFIKMVERAGHEVVCVTMRYPQEAVEGIDIRTIYTGRKAKGPFMKELGEYVDVWIDDSPMWVVQDALA